MQTILVANAKGGVGKTTLAVTLATALAARGNRVALADADRQQSSLGWLMRRPVTARSILALDWTRAGDIGESPKRLDWLVIDAPGALKGSRAEALLAEARAVLVPVQPSAFDMASTAAFLAEIEDIKRVRKGKVDVMLVANRCRAGARAAADLAAMFAELGRPLDHQIAERAAYASLAGQGLGLFDRDQKSLAPLKAQWSSILAALGA